MNGHCSGSFSSAPTADSPSSPSAPSPLESSGCSLSPNTKMRLVSSPSLPLWQLPAAQRYVVTDEFPARAAAAACSVPVPFGVPRWGSRSSSLTGSLSLSVEHFRHPDLRRDTIPSIPRVGAQCQGSHMCLTCALNVVAAAAASTHVPLAAPIAHPDMIVPALPSPSPPSPSPSRSPSRSPSFSLDTPTDEREHSKRVHFDSNADAQVDASVDSTRTPTAAPVRRARQQRAGSSTAVLGGGAHVHTQAAASGPTPAISVTAPAPNETPDVATNATDLLQTAGTHQSAQYAKTTE